MREDDSYAARENVRAHNARTEVTTSLPGWSYFMARNMSTNHKKQQSKLKPTNKADSDCLSHHSSQSSIDCKQQTPVLVCISQTLDNHGSDGTSGS